MTKEVKINEEVLNENKITINQTDVEEQGKNLNPFLQYFKYSRNYIWLFVLFIILAIASESFSDCTYFFLVMWIGSNRNKINLIDNDNSNFTKYSYEMEKSDFSNITFDVTVYTIITLATVLCYNLKNLTHTFVSTKISKVIHDKALDSLLNAPMKLFDRTPGGRILDTFSKDMGSVDETFPFCLNCSIRVI